MEIKKPEELTSLIENEEKLILIDFYATWCGPCKMLSPILANIADEMSDKVVVAKIDVDSNPQLTSNFKVNAMPTLVFFKDKKEVGREVGYITFDDLVDLIENKYLNK